MADNKADFELWLKSKWDGNALSAAEAAFKKTQGAAKDAGRSFDDLGYSAKNLKAQLASVFALAELVAQFKEGFEQVAALEQAMNQLERATKRNGDNFDVVKGKIVGMADALKKAAGVDDDAAIKKMAELYNATGDVANAMSLVATATDVSIGAGIEFERAFDLVRNAALGNVRSLKELNISIETTGDKTKDADRALAAISANFGGAAENAKGYRVELNRLSEAYEDNRNTLVERLLPALTVGMKGIESFFVMLDGFWRMLSSTLVSSSDAVVNAGSAIWKALKGDFTGARESWTLAKKDMAEWGDDVVESFQSTSKKVTDVWSGVGEKIQIATNKPKNIVRDGGGGGEGTKRELTQEERDLMAVADFERKIYLERIEETEKFEENKLKLKKIGAAEYAKIEKNLDSERDEMFRRTTAQILAEARLRKQVEESRRTMAVQTAEGLVGLGRAVFGDSKEIAIAEAIVNTASGVVEALPNYVLAALVAATGVAEIAKIASTEPGGSGDVTAGAGFDNPANDAAARIGGRRWAADMIGEFTQGVSQGWAQGMGASRSGGTVSNDNRTTNNYNISAAGFLDPSDSRAMSRFARKLAVVNKTVEGQRRTARTGS